MIHKTLSLCSLTVVLSCNVIIPMQPGSTQTSSSSSSFSSRSSTSDSAVTDFYSAAAARSAANTPAQDPRIPQVPLPNGSIGGLLYTNPILQSMENPTINGDLRNQMDWARGIADGAAQATNFLGRGNPAANMQEGIPMQATHSAAIDFIRERSTYNQQESSYYEVPVENQPETLNKTAIKIAPRELKKKLGAMRDPRLACIKLLFTGEPGTGKSTVALAVAQKLNSKLGVNYKLFDTTQMAGEVQNSGERNLRTAFAPILEANTENKWVAILEELDKFVAPRQNTQERSEGTALALNMILNQCLRNPNIVIIGITNNSDVFPGTLKSRFEEIEFPLPGKNERYEVIKCNLKLLKEKKYTVADACFKDRFLWSAAKYTDGMTIREIETAINDIINSDETDEEIQQEERWWVGDNADVPAGAAKSVTTTNMWATLKKHRPYKPWFVVPLMKNTYRGLQVVGQNPIVINILTHVGIQMLNQAGTNLNIKVMDSEKWKGLAKWLPWYSQALQTQAQEQQHAIAGLQRTLIETQANDAEDAISRQKNQLQLARDQYKLSQSGLNLSQKQFLYQILKDVFPSYRTFDFTKESIIEWMANQKNLLEVAPRYPAVGSSQRVFDEWHKKNASLAPVLLCDYEGNLANLVLDLRREEQEKAK